MRKARFITLEGIDGAGKSTQMPKIEAVLKSHGVEYVMTREPGGTPVGEKLREILLHQAMEPETEALMMFASRAEHIATVIKPALEKGKWVISDRFTDASFAYQGGGRGIPFDRLENLEQWVQKGFQPDLTLLFDVPVEIARKRLSKNESLDRFEHEREAFFERVRKAYLDRASRHPERFLVMDSSLSIEAIHAGIEQAISSLCP